MNKKFVQHLKSKIVKNNEKQDGFTLLEMSFAMVFLSFILLFVVTVLMHMVSIYNKGISISKINAAGQQIMTDLNGARFNGVIVSVPDQNRICVNGISYLWNIASDHQKMDNTNGSGQSLVRVLDPSGAMCQKSAGDYPKFNGDGSQAMPESVKKEDINYILASTTIIQSVELSNNVGLPERIKMVISTSGNNAPAVWSGKREVGKDDWAAGGAWIGNISGTGTKGWGRPSKYSKGYTCGTNKYCSYVEYDLVIYQRN